MESTEDIKARLDIVDLIGEHLTLKQAGSGSFKAICPFHQERTPSFHVSRPRQSWHCFGCNQGGDVFSFVMKMEGLEFPEALSVLAQKAGVVLPQFNVDSTNHKKKLYEINELAVRFFRSALINLPQALVAREYVKKRGLDDLTCDVFRLGYAPDGWSTLVTALTAKQISEDEMVEAGLVSRREQGGVYDRFRDRLMFPIHDVYGHVVGFTGRLLTDDKQQAKYMNTPETKIYRKSTVLYGLDKAKGEIRTSDLAVIVEGNMDVISSHQFGINNVVASSGTALTYEQLGLLKRFTKNLAIAFDQDAAGQAATLRGLDMARAAEFNIRVIVLPPEAGKDPDEAVRKDPEIWRRAIDEAVTIVEWIYRRAFQGRSLNSPEDKKAVAQNVLPELARIVDPVERDHWLQRLAKDLTVSEQALREAMQRKKGLDQPVQTHVIDKAKEHATLEPGLEEQILARGMFRRILFCEMVTVDKDWFVDPELRLLYEKWQFEYAPARQDSIASWREDQLMPPSGSLTPEQLARVNKLAFLAERECQNRALEELKRELKNLCETLRAHFVQHRRDELAVAMREAELSGDHSAIKRVSQAFHELLT